MLNTLMNSLITFQYIWSSMLPNLTLLAESSQQAQGLKYIGVGLSTMSFFGVTVGQGAIGACACSAIGRNPEASQKITVAGMIFAGVTESGAIYGLIFGILMLFVV